MKKILVSFLLINGFAVLAEEKKDYGLFEDYYTRKPLLSRLTGSDKGTQHIGIISDSEDQSLSIRGYLNYLKMLQHCKEKNLVSFTDSGTVYVCAANRLFVLAAINSLKKTRLENFGQMGTTLQKGGIAHLPSSDRSDQHVFVAFDNLNGTDIDPVELGFKVSQMVKESAYGVSVIDVHLVKIVTAPNNSSIKVSEILPTEEKIEQAKAKISQ